MRSVEVFAGAGGLAIGMAKAGFHHAAVIELDHQACENFRDNQRHHNPMVEEWPVHEVDAREFDYSKIGGNVDVVSGGPPCQPFSQGGKHKAQRDSRNMFPEAIRAVRELSPKAFIFENVKGFTRKSFDAYFSYTVLQLQHPEIQRIKGENWLQHRLRLEQHHTSSKLAPTYNVVFDILNAADFGVPQKRQRVFFVGFRSDLGAKWSFPIPTHSEEELLRAKWVTGTYWDHHKIAKNKRPQCPDRLANKIEALREIPLIGRHPWRTVRDALEGLPDPEVSSAGFKNHNFIAGARSYVGHTGSVLDEPAKTLKAGHHGVPGGENMLVKADGSVRYFTVREAAELQTFPSTYEFSGAWTTIMRQLGNAVPVALAEAVAKSVADAVSQIKTPQTN